MFIILFWYVSASCDVTACAEMMACIYMYKYIYVYFLLFISSFFVFDHSIVCSLQIAVA